MFRAECDHELFVHGFVTVICQDAHQGLTSTEQEIKLTLSWAKKKETLHAL